MAKVVTEFDLQTGEDRELWIFSKSSVRVEVMNGGRLKIIQPSDNCAVQIENSGHEIHIGTMKDIQLAAPDTSDVTIFIPKALAPKIKVLAYFQNNEAAFIGKPGCPVRMGSIIALSANLRGDYVEFVDEFIQIGGPKAHLEFAHASVDPGRKSEKQRIQADDGASINVDFLQGTEGPFRVLGSNASKSIFVTGIDKWSLQRKEDPGASVEQMGVIRRTAQMPPLPTAQSLSEGGIGL